MAMGYEGLVLVKVDTIEDLALASGGGVPSDSNRLESSSGYGGQIKTPVAEIGLGTPRNYGWSSFDGSVDLELTEDFWVNQIKAWVFDRQKGAEITLQTRGGNTQDFLKCYWNSISISASEGSNVTASIGFVAMQRDVYTIGGDYLTNKQGSTTFCGSPTFNVPEPLNANLNLAPVPFWNTTAVLGGILVPLVDWNLEFSQEVVKFFSCESDSTVQEPRFVGVGPMTARFSGDYVFVGTPVFSAPGFVATLDLTIGSVTMSMEDLEITSVEDSIADSGSTVPIVFDYAIYELVS